MCVFVGGGKGGWKRYVCMGGVCGRGVCVGGRGVCMCVCVHVCGSERCKADPIYFPHSLPHRRYEEQLRF